MKIRPENCIDFYKSDHDRQYTPGTTLVYSNFTPRSAVHAPIPKHLFSGKVIFFGLQYFIIDFLMDTFSKEFFALPKDQVVTRFKCRFDNALGKDAVSAEKIETLHDLGYLPLEIRALPEGAKVNIKVPPFIVFNTVDGFFWLTNYLESVISAYMWKPMTSATTAYHYHLLLSKYAEETGAPLEFVDFQGHDFSFRGMSGLEDAAMSGAGHLTSFKGTDTVIAIDLLEDYYGANSDEEFIGGSVPATEHSVMCMGGKDDELGTIRRLITEVYPKGIASVVSDTWDFWQVITEHAMTLKPEIIARDGKVVFRPDSGDPVDIICGSVELIHLNDDFDIANTRKLRNYFWTEATKDVAHGESGDDTTTLYFSHKRQIYKGVSANFWNRYDKQYYYLDECAIAGLEPVTLTPEQKGAVECLWDNFGGTETSNGFKVLDSHVGLIYGDSITIQRAEAIMKRLKAKGFASCNVVLGIGSFTYEYVTRDTFGFAMKATYGIVNGEGRSIFKSPKTDNGVKKSAKGLLKVMYEPLEGYVLYDEQTDINDSGELVPVFRDGELLVRHTLAEIRERVKT